jgi:hypothetical protein
VPFSPRVLVQFVGLKGGATPHVGGRRRVQVRRHATAECLHLRARQAQFTGETRGRFTFGNATEKEHQGRRALTGLRQRRTGEQRVVALTATTPVGGKVGWRSKQPPLAAPTAWARQPTRVQMAFQPDQADAVV